MEKDKLRNWLKLKSVPGIGDSKLSVLVKYFGSPEAVFSASTESLTKLPGISMKNAMSIKGFQEEEGIQEQIGLIEKYGVRVITFFDEEYPSNLRNISEAPPFLFLRGSVCEKDNQAVAIVGSRAATEYGKSVAEKLAFELASRGITIVSGMARGIDSAAHRGALTASGRTIAVLGCGVDMIYPPENKDLKKKIIENGAIFSEFPMRAKPEKEHFPRRNRIISGLSLGVIAVEAKEDSGVMSTVQWALDQGRDVFAVPGPVTASTSKGTNFLIKQGAKIVTCVDDIFEELNLETGKPKLQKFETILNDRERVVWDALGDSTRHIDEIAKISGFSISEMLDILLSLELKGVVKQHPGKNFSRT